MKDQEKVIININDTSRPVIQNIQSYQSSILSDPIESAIRMFKAVMTENDQFLKLEKDHGSGNGLYDDWSFRVNNNIIAFVGDRGSGKTSCMLSTANCLKDMAARDIDQPGSHLLGGCYFLQVIDPSFFDETHNILDLFIGELYKQFKNYCNSHRCARTHDDIIRLQAHFDQLKSDMRYLEKPPISFDDYEESEALEFLCSGVYLQTNLRQVVQEFLRFIGRKTIVMCIDDLDLNVQRCYEMMEQVRKYLMMPEAVIMLSAKMEQLHQAVQLKLLEFYRPTYHDTDGRHTLSYDVSEMADRYISKLLPLNHRIYMPEVSVFLDSPMEIVGGESPLSFANLSDGILDMIFQKTRYLFYNSDDTKSLIIPRNLRNLNHLVRLLYDMPDFDGSVALTTENSQAAIQNRRNKARFKKYFFSDWLSQLSSEKIDKARMLILEQEPDTFNKRVIGYLDPRYYNEENLERITDSNNLTYNVSLGDVLTLIDYLQKIYVDHDDLLYLFFIKSLYSMRLYEAYDRMTDTLKTGMNANDKLMSDRPMLRNSVLADVPDFIKLVGGAYFSPDRFAEFMPDGRDRRLLDGNFINRKIRALTADYEKKSKEGDIDGWRETLDDMFVKEVRLMEFIAFTSLRHVQGKDQRRLEGLANNYRTIPYPYYLRSLSNTGNIMFDAAAPLFKCILPLNGLAVYGSSFSNMCRDMNTPGRQSLTNMMLTTGRRYDGTVTDEADLASRIALRNTDVVIDVYSTLLRSRDRYRPIDAGEIGIYIDFYKCLASYAVKSYALDATGQQHHSITLRPIEHIVAVLEDVAQSAELLETFDNCFANYTENVPEKNSPASARFMAGFVYDPKLIRSIIFKHYPEYENRKEIRDRIKYPQVNRSEGTAVVKYLANTFKGKTAFENAIGEDLMETYTQAIKAANGVDDHAGAE